MPNTSCMIYMIPPANFHNPNSFNSSCTSSKAVEAEEVTAVVEPAELSPSIERRSHPALSGETFDGPPSLERSGSEHRVGRFPPSPLRVRGGALFKGKEGRGDFRRFLIDFIKVAKNIVIIHQLS
jgi:hypothetical protein